MSRGHDSSFVSSIESSYKGMRHGNWCVSSTKG